MLHIGGEGHTAGNRGFVAGVVDEVDGSGAGHEIDGRDEDDEESRAQDVDDIEFHGSPEGYDFIWAHAEEL